MKKRVIALALALGLAAAAGGGALAASGGQLSSLVSRSYLEGTFLSELAGRIEGWVESALAPIYQDAEAELDRVGQSASGGGSVPAGWSSSGRYTPQSGARGDTVSLSQGSGILWTAGTATAQGELVDVTAGAVLASGQTLQVNHRYLAGEQSTVTVTSQSAAWSVEGIWKAGETTLPEPDFPFQDVAEGAWYREDVRFVYENGLFSGTGNSQFSPGQTMDRGMMTTVLHRLAGEPAVEYEPIFQDVAEGLWYAPGTVWAGQNGIMAGVGGGRFAPKQLVTRQEIAVALYRYAEFVGADTSGRGDLSDFSDQGNISSWAREALAWAVAEGIVRGSDGGVNPRGEASRAEVAAMFHRFADWLES